MSKCSLCGGIGQYIRLNKMKKGINICETCVHKLYYILGRNINWERFQEHCNDDDEDLKIYVERINVIENDIDANIEIIDEIAEVQAGESSADYEFDYIRELIDKHYIRLLPDKDLPLVDATTLEGDEAKVLLEKRLKGL